MNDFDQDRLPGLHRLSAVLAGDRNKDLPAKQLDAYLREDERRAWRDTLAQRLAIRAAGIEGDLPQASRDYWDQLRDLYARNGRRRTPLQERAFCNAVEALWEDFQNLDAQCASYFEEATGANLRWGKIPHALGDEFHVLKCGSAFHHWWYNPKGWSQWELIQSVIDQLQATAVASDQSAPKPISASVRAAIARMNR